MGLKGLNGQQKRAACFATLLQNELESDVARFTTYVQQISQQIRFVQVAKSCCRKKRVVLLFATKLVHVERCHRPKENVFNFAASDVAPVYQVTPA